MSKSATPCAVCGKPTRAETGVCQRTAPCRTEHNRRYAQAKPEGRRERGRRRRLANPEGVRRAKVRYYESGGRETLRAYQDANKDTINAQRRARRDTKGPEYWRVKELRTKHGMRPEDWAALYDAQAGCCYLCDGELDLVKNKAIAVDHDHSCCGPNKSCPACRRGLACSGCNLAIGMVHEDPARLRRIADALEVAQLEVERRRAAADQIVTLF